MTDEWKGNTYIPWIRNLFGKQKIPLVFATAIIVNDRGEILWQSRRDFGWWGLSGGVLEFNETLEECACREALEETGLIVHPTKLSGLYSSPGFDYIYPNGDQVHQITACYVCNICGGQLEIDLIETLSLKWFPPEKSPPTSPWYTAMITDYLKDSVHPIFQHSPAQRSTSLCSNPPYDHPIFTTPNSCILPAGFLLVENEGFEYLFVKQGNSWSLPGGIANLQERMDISTLRQAYEQSGFEIMIDHLINVYSGKQFWLENMNGGKRYQVNALFRGKVIQNRSSSRSSQLSNAAFFRANNVSILPSWQQRMLEQVISGKIE
jgi:ADP-ribose pyrophosphatase YjhB (NUDIX family)